MKSLLIALPLVAALGLPAFANIPKSFRSDSSGTLPAGVRKVTGTVGRWVSWQDTRGENVAVFSQDSKVKTRKDGTKLESLGLYVTVFSGKNGQLKRVREVRELVNACQFDLTNEVRETSVGISDLDGDGVGELTFAYVSGCRSDVSPLAMKVLMLEGADKHALRGVTRVKNGSEWVGGQYEADFGKRAPSSFHEHASKVWTRFAAE